MTKLAAIAFAILGLLAVATPPAAAQWTGQRIGHIDYWNGPGGQTVTCRQVGHITYCN